MGRNIGKNISKNLSSKCCQKFLDHAKQAAVGELKMTSKRASKCFKKSNPKSSRRNW